MEKVTDSFADTGQVIERDPTSKELQQAKLDIESYNQAKADEAATLVAKEAILAKIGLTADELALLFQ